jgi:hypothetical protein
MRMPGNALACSGSACAIVGCAFGRELMTSVLWLNRFEGMDIRCIQLVPYRLDDRVLLDIRQVVPLSEAADYQVRVRRKEQQQERVRNQSRDMTRYHVIVDGAELPATSKRETILAMVTKRALDDARTDRETAHRQETPGYSISAISLATLRYSPRAINSIGFSSSNARIGRFSQTAIDSGRTTRASRRIISPSSISRSARAPVGSLRPASHPRTVLGFAPVAAAIVRSPASRPTRPAARRARCAAYVGGVQASATSTSARGADDAAGQRPTSTSAS